MIVWCTIASSGWTVWHCTVCGVHTIFLFNGYSCVCWAVNVLLNANVHVSVFPPLYDVFSSCFAAGALGPAEPSQAQTIYQAVVDKNWGTATKLLIAVMEGKLSGSVWSVSSLGEEHSVVDSWFLARFMYLQPFSCDDVDAEQPFSWMDDTFRYFSFNCTACQKTHIMCSLQLDSTSWCMMNQRKFECHTLRRWTRD